MDASEQFAFPSPQPQDSQEVREAIEQAGILWSEDPKESLKWLRKAAEIASDAGDDLRSVQLARVSADLRNLANISPSVPPPTTLPPISHPLPSAPVVVGDSTEAAAASVAAVVVAPVIAAATAGEQPADASAAPESSSAAGTPAESGSSADSSGSLGENTVRDQAAIEQQSTPDAPAVDDASATPAAPPAEPMVAIPQFAFSKDPAQTVPATPAASAAAIALASAPAGYQSVPAPASAAPAPANGGPLAGPGAAAVSNSAVSNSALANNGVANVKRQVLFGGPAAAGGPRPEQPTLVGRPLPLGVPNGPRGVNDETPAATPAAIQADSVAPGSGTPRFVQHKAIAVSISMAPNAAGHFDLHPLAEGESVEPGFRRALLIALAPEDRLFPGRG